MIEILEDSKFDALRDNFVLLRDTLYLQGSVHSKNWRIIDNEINKTLDELMENEYAQKGFTKVTQNYIERLEKFVAYRNGRQVGKISDDERKKFADMIYESKQVDMRDSEMALEITRTERAVNDLEGELAEKFAEARIIVANKEKYIDEAADLPIHDIEEVRYAQLIEQCEREYDGVRSLIKQLVDSIDITTVALQSVKDKKIYKMLQDYQVASDKVRDTLIDNIVMQKELGESTAEIKSIVRSANKVRAKDTDDYKMGMEEINKRRAQKLDVLDDKKSSDAKGLPKETVDGDTLHEKGEEPKILKEE